MAIDSYLYFEPYTGPALTFESQVKINSGGTDELGAKLAGYASAGNLCEVTDYSFDIEQQLNIGSQSKGAGAGKVTFNPFSITRSIDKASPLMFANCCAGTPFKLVQLFLRKATGAGISAGTANAGTTFVRFDFKLVAVKTISWGHDDESPKETLTFEYGALLISYAMQNADGTMKAMPTQGWNRVNNVQDTNPTAAIT